MTFVERGTAASIYALIMSDYHHTYLFSRIEQAESPAIQLHDESLLQVNSMGTLFLMYFFHYCRGTLSVTFHLRLSAEDVTTTSASGMTVGGNVLDNDAKVWLLDGRYHLEVMG